MTALVRPLPACPTDAELLACWDALGRPPVHGTHGEPVTDLPDWLPGASAYGRDAASWSLETQRRAWRAGRPFVMSRPGLLDGEGEATDTGDTAARPEETL